MRIAVVDDEERWRIVIETLLKKYPWKELIEIDTFVCGEDFCDKEGYDVVFMDVEMGKMDGFEAAHLYKQNNEEAIIIFLTSHTEFSRKGYIVNAFRYIDKKEIETELKEALLAIEDLQSRNHIIHFHVIKTGEISLRVKDVLFIETVKRNVVIHTKGKNYISNRKIDELEEELEPWGFFRSHKSYLVNVENIDDVGKDYAYFKNGSKALVSTRKHIELKDLHLEYRYNHANS